MYEVSLTECPYTLGTGGGPTVRRVIHLTLWWLGPTARPPWIYERDVNKACRLLDMDDPGGRLTCPGLPQPPTVRGVGVRYLIQIDRQDR